MSAPPDPLAELLRRTAESWDQGRRNLDALRTLDAVRVGSSERECVYSEDKIRLYRYAPLARSAGLAPLLICYAMVNRPYMLDLQPDRSLIRDLLFQGIEVYLLDWGCPDGADRFIPLANYIAGYLHRAVRFILERHSRESLSLLGVCQGGTFSLCYAALEPRHVANLICMVTPVDFKTPENLLSKWVQHVDVELMSASGNIPGGLLNLAFLALMPFRLTQQKYVDLLQSQADRAKLESFMRMERWIFDSPDQPACAFREFVRWFFQENRLIHGRLELGGRGISLRNIRCPVLNVYALKDHLVPPSASICLGAHVGGEVYDTLPVDVGHIGMYVSSRARDTVPGAIAAWLRRR